MYQKNCCQLIIKPAAVFLSLNISIDKCIYIVYTNVKGVDNMRATIQKWGNSQAIRLPKAVLETATINENEQVSILAERNQIIIKKSRKHREHIPLAERLKDWNGQPYELNDEDKAWLDLEPVGDEV
ncbi:MAG: AbrB/MazE/SpoVT family DNA-binding domain-containing protein [Defluviitaleaceae bacterium]|nr:AbrB/MazE/SpoVT family DNA-binding domain-containing protein [Defluviitaleaceae bacterium]